jgi:hypothetical protein
MKDLWSIFRNDNSWNEKTIIGFLSFAMMVFTAVIDITTGIFGENLEVHEFIYNSFVIVTIGSFGIAGLEGVLKKNSTDE